MELDMLTVGERIKKRRNELGLSQTDIYKECEITSGALSKIAVSYTHLRAHET